MKYMNRVCNLISGGRHESEAAILYHGDAEWTGMGCMYNQDPARVLTEAQIGFDFVPSDIFTDEVYQTNLDGGLHVYRQSYRIFIVPECDYLTKETAQAMKKLAEQGFPCVCVNSYPKGICSNTGKAEERELIEAVHMSVDCVLLDALADYMRERNMACVQIAPKENYLRVYQYYGDPEILYLVNEGTNVYEGIVSVPGKTAPQYRYLAWENRLEAVEAQQDSTGAKIRVRIEPGKSWIFVWDAEFAAEDASQFTGNDFDPDTVKLPLTTWDRSVCSSIAYPAFGEQTGVVVPDFAEKELPDFAGMLRYETNLEWKEMKQTSSSDVILEITDAGEAVQLFINGEDCGIQIVPPYRYEIGTLLKDGENRIAIEVATTLERQIPPKNKKDDWEPKNHVGLCGDVYLCKTKEDKR